MAPGPTRLPGNLFQPAGCRNLQPMSKTPSRPGRPVLIDFKFGATALIGSLVMALVSTFAPLAAQIAVLGAFVSILGGLFVAYLEQEGGREARRNEVLERLSVPLALAPEHDLYEQYLAICRGLTELARSTDPILRETAVLKLGSVAGEIDALASGTVVFAGTEGWRTVYEQLLKSPDLKQYRSVAWVRTTGYWGDPPGRASLQANFAAAHRGVLIERVVIVSDHLWPASDPLPADDVRGWVQEQHDHGLWVCLVRESALAREPDLLADIGIYGDRAVGVQDLDESSKTVRFTLKFDPQTVRQAQERWRRLLLFATSLREILDRLPPDR